MRRLSSKMKFKIAYRDNFTCQFCGAMPGNDNIEIEHLVPVAKHGSDNEENLVAACRKCNRSKSDMVMFPKSMCEGINEDEFEKWTIHRSFGKWQILFHQEHGIVLEFAPYGYWIAASRAHDQFWENHILEKRWPEPHKDLDFIEALTYFRRIVSSA
jgi:hypothetical protein